MQKKNQNEITVLIVARNAATTIGRAISSVRNQASCPILLVDDHSTDRTVAISKKAANYGLEVISPPIHGSLGETRQYGLNHVKTPLTILLDADDAYLPGRILRCQEDLQKRNASIWTDEVILMDGTSGRKIKKLSIPEFILKHQVPFRLFERNYLPGIGQIGFVTDTAQKIKYDTTLHGPEDIDLVLRMLLNGAKVTYCKEPGYLMYAYPNSVSRNLQNQLEMYRRCLQKYSVNNIIKFYNENGSTESESIWGAVYIHIRLNQFNDAIKILEELNKKSNFKNSNDWRPPFYLGSLYLICNKNHEALDLLESALNTNKRPDIINNYGVCLRRLRRENKAKENFNNAITLYPQYLDAHQNLKSFNYKDFITLPELYTKNSRDIYIL